MKQKSYFGERKTRVKMYKAGSHWVSALMTLCGFELLMSGAAAPAHADSTPVNPASNANVVRVASSQSNTASQQLALRGTSAPQTQGSSSAAAKTTRVAGNSAASTKTQPSRQSSAASSASQSSQKSAQPNKQTQATSQQTSSAASLNNPAASSSSTPTAQLPDKQAQATKPVQVTPAMAAAMHKQAMQQLGKAPVATNRTEQTDAAANQQAAATGVQGKEARGILDGFGHYGSWTIYFVDENGNPIYDVQGYSNAGADYVDSQVTPIVDALEENGYKYDYVDPNSSYAFDIGGFWWTYVTLVFQQVPRQVGGAVKVKYMSTDGKTLAKGIAYYKTPVGARDAMPHIGDTYLTFNRTFIGYHLVKAPANPDGKVTTNAQTIVYLYAPDQETLHIDFIDQNGNQIIKEVPVTGGYHTTVTFNVQDYVDKNLPGYEIVSNNWPANGVYIESTYATKPFRVVLKHKMATSTQTKVVTQTINYQYSNGKRAFAPKVTKITFTRTVTTDEVTGQQTFGDWTTTDQTTFPAVQSPKLTGYTASPTSSTAVTGITADSPDNVQTVVYVANKEQITVTFVDMDEGKVLLQKSFEGDYGTSPDFDYQSVIQKYINRGYNVALDTIPSGGLTFTDSDNQSYEVDLTHTHTKLPVGAKGCVKVITHTIHYIYSNGSPAEPDVVQSITYTRGATRDNVTGEITYTDWSTKDNPEFPSVKSPQIKGYMPSMAETPVIQVTDNSTNVITTVIYDKNAGTQKPQSPTKTTVTETINYVNTSGTALLTPTTVTKTFTRTQNADGTYGPWTTTDGTSFPAVTAPQITGYTPTPGSVAEIDNVTATTANISRTIVYTPVQDTITINYVDQTENGKLIHTDTYSGTYDSTTPNTTQAEIAALEKQGYKLVGNNLPDPSAANLTFTSDQTYTITFEHTYTQGKEEQSVSETINYQFQNGTQAADPYTKTLTFTRTQTKDNVTGQSTYGAWSPSGGQFPAVTSPQIKGYNVSQSVVDAINVTGDTSNIVKTVIYTPIQETVSVQYVDDTTGKVITVINLTGGYGTHSNYSTADDIKKLEAAGYDLVSDGFPSSGFVFGDSSSTYTVHMKERIVDGQNTKTVTQTITYVDQNGNQVASPHTATITFTQPTKTNAVTGVVTTGDWTPASQTFAPVASPKVTGYTPTAAESTAVTVNAPTATSTPKDVNQQITYTQNQEKIEIQYIDQTTGQVMLTDYSTGLYGTRSNYNPAPTMEQYIESGYKIVSDDFPQTGVTFTQDGTVPVYKIVFAHNTRTDTATNNPDKVADLTKKVTRTITYTYAGTDKQAASPVTETVTFNRTATVDMVSHQVISYSDWTTTDKGFPAVQSPTIPGYTANPATVSANTNVTADSTDSTVNVTYTANKESATVTYVDATMGKTLQTDDVTGTYGSTSDYSPNATIQKYEDEGYKLESSDFPSGGITFNKDGNGPTYTYTIKLVHNITTDSPESNPDNVANLTKTVTQTIHYVYGSNTGKAGQTAAKDATTSITFDRTATYDHVTKQVTYGAWSPASGDFPAVKSPAITGYTPSAATSTEVDDVTPTSDNNVQTITYNANAESVQVQYVDQTEGGKVMSTATVDGTYGATVKYDPSAVIKQYEAKGYKLVKNGVPANGIVFNQDGNYTPYQVVFVHGTTTETPESNPDKLTLTKTVTRTITYTYAGTNKQAAKPVTQTVTFTRTATKDNVTGDITYSDWTPSGSTTDAAVPSPKITGYTPSEAEVPAVTISATDSDSTVNVTYTANKESAIVNYVDATTGKVLHSDTITGTYGSASDYNPNTLIKQYEGEGYQLESNNYPTNGEVFNDDGHQNVYTIKLVEGTTQYTPSDNPKGLELTHTVTQTIHYKYADGTQAKPDHTASITFNRTATENNVTHVITYSPWTNTGTTDEFEPVTTPAITGYTPSAAASAAVDDVTAATPDNVQTITYTPNQEKITVTYVDETTGKQLHVDTLNGAYNTTSSYSPDTEIAALEKEGYVLDKNGYPQGGAKFDVDGKVLNYTITFKHGTTTETPESNPDKLTLTKTVTRTITYTYAGTDKQAAKPVTQTVTFTRTATKDNVTGDITYSDWTPSGSTTDAAVPSPKITGYTPSEAEVPAATISATDSDSTVNVTYTANKESATVTYVDATTGKTLQTDDVTGTYGSTSDYSPNATIQKYEDEGYKLESSDFPSGGITFNKDGNGPTYTYTIKLVHNITTDSPESNPDNVANLTKTVTQTIHYVYGSNTGKAGQTAAKDATTSITFDRTATYDHVTKQVTYGAWSPASGDFPAVKSPAITGYTPSAATSTEVDDVTPTSDNNVQTITYNANAESVQVQYVDQTEGGKVMSTATVDGTYGATVKYDPSAVIKQYEAKGYKLVKNGVPANGIVFNQDGNYTPYQVVFVHGTTTETPESNPDKLTLTKTVTRTITYTYAGTNKQAAKPVTQTVTFTRTATKDNVTGDITYSDWTPSGSTTDAAVPSPKITGYTPSEAEVPAVTISATDSDSTVNVTYTANKESAIVNYVDATTGKVLHSDTITGTYGSASDYNPNTLIKQYEGEGYQLESNNYPTNGEVFNDDGHQNVYTIKLVEGTTQYTPSDNPKGLELTHTVTQTIHYKYADGTQAKPDHTASITFNRTATENNVTHVITYSPWTNTGTTDEFEPVTTPAITGYTPSAAASAAVDDVTAATPDNVQTITYTPNQEKITVTYVDETTGKQLHVDTLNGAYNTTSSYSPDTEIAALEKEGYVLDKNGYPQGGAKFDVDGKVLNYTITFKHGTTTETPESNPDKLTLTKTVTRTITYTYAGTDKQAAKPVTQTVTFTRTATKDNVTGDITYSDWTPSGSTTDAAVPSPKITGYTPSEAEVPAATISATDSDSTVNVTYTANKESATVTYVDATTGKTLQTDDVTGTYGSTSDYSPNATIQKYEDEGYKLESSDFPSGGITFNKDGNGPTYTYTIKLVHNITTDSPESNPDNVANLTKTVTQTIHYVYGSNTGKAGQTAAKDATTSITFDRTATYDHVTKQVTYGAWSPASGDFPAVKSPAITGYTPSAATSTEVDDVTPTSDNNVQTITYNANAESVQVQYVDQTEGGKVMSTATVDGTYGATVKYDPSAVIKQYEAKGYKLVKNGVPANGIVFNQDGNYTPYQVVFVHGTTTETPESNPDKLTLTKTVTRTITYTYAGTNKQAAKPVTQTVTFTRTATKDNVTGDITYSDWTPSGSTTDAAVPSPKITGYTPSEAEVPAVTISATDSDSTVNVTYTANKESAIVNYVDATTGKVLHSDTITGTYGSASDYNPNTLIKQYEGEGYQLESNNYPTNGEVFNDDGHQNVYTIKLVEGTTQYTPSDNPKGLELTHTVTQTIHYKYADGTQAKPDHTASITFNRTATENNVTHVITYSPWTNTGTTDEFEPVTTPAITGYTPSAAASAAVDDVTAATPDNVQTITYTPNQEKITVTYVDETTGKQLHVDTLNGAYNTTSSYSPDTEIAALEKEGYVLDKNGYPQGGAKFDVDGKVLNYTITFKHGTTTETPESNPDKLTLTKTVTRTITYTYAGTDKQAAKPVTQTVTFTRTATKDNVTGDITYSDWTPSGSTTDAAVPSPKITGYTPSEAEVPAATISATDSDSTVNVTYTANKESATVTYVDATTGKTLQTDDVTGTYGSTSDYSPNATIQKYEDEGYKLESSDFPSGGITFNKDGNGPTYTYTIKLVHNITTDSPESNPDNVANLTKTVTQTIHYVYGSNTGKAGQTAAKDATTSITFDRTATYDHVTKQVTYGAWSPASGDFPAVKSPAITGYTPSAATSTEVDDVTPTSDNNVQTITYNANAESVQVQYVDQTEGGKVMSTATVDGTYGATVKYDPSAVIKQYEAKGYKLVKNGVPANGIVFNQDGNYTPYQVVFVHGTTTETPESNPDKLTLTKTVTRTITYTYAGTNKQAAKPVTQTVTFTRTATKDNVTGDITYSDWTPSGSTTDAAVPSPKITGYTPSEAEVPAVTISATDSDSTVNVTYTANKESAIVNYVDATTGKVLHSDTITGTYGSASDYNPNTLIKQYEGEGYQLESNNYPTNGEVFNDDGHQNVYTIKLVEGTTQYTPSDNPKGLELTHTVTQTIHYKYADGTQAKPDHTASITFNRTATENNVTHVITYSPWTNTGTTDEFEPVTTPAITGYTPSAAASAAVDDVTAATPDNVQTITYTPNQEKITVTYVDETTGKQLHVDTLNGAYNTTSSYSPDTEIAALEKEGYVLDKNGYPQGGAKFDVDGKVLNYTITFKHGTTTETPESNPDKLTLTKTVTRTITYTYAGTDKQAAKPVTQTVTFTRTATKDNVTGDITYSDWTPSGSTTDAAVPSPKITGYTPSEAEVPAATISATDSDSTVNVTYTANKESATVTYVDATTGKTLQTDDVTGTYGSTSDYSPNATIQKYEDEGYKLESSDFPSGGITFNKDGNGPTYTYTIKLVHNITTDSPASNADKIKNLTDTVIRKIIYQYTNGKKAANAKTETIKFTRTASLDHVTGKVTYSPWKAVGKDDFAPVKSPKISGYNPNVSVVPEVDNVAAGTANKTVTVIYGADTERATVTYVDDTTGKPLKTVTLHGKFGTTSAYDPEKQVKQYEAQGYKLVNSNYPTDGVRFDQPNTVQHFVVHLKEGTTTYTAKDNPQHLDLTHTVKRVITFVGPNGQQLAPTVTQTVTFHRTATKNDVTGKVTYGPWTADGSATFAPVTVPTVAGYTPAELTVPAMAVTATTGDTTVTVKYSAAPIAAETHPQGLAAEENDSHAASQGANKGATQLPDTGDSQTNGLWGLILLAVAGVLSSLGIKSNKRNDGKNR